MNKKIFFSDKHTYNKDEKTVVSVRDGIQEYLGAEIGMAPETKVFKIYRSPETIRAIADNLKGIPITDEHVELEDIPENKILGYIDDSRIINLRDSIHSSTLAILNKVKLKDSVIQLAHSKNQLSLGYFADLKEHDLYDFEQTNITPHHLAIVKSGRCGSVCNFKDKGNILMNEAELKAEAERIAAEKAKLEADKEALEAFKDSTDFKDAVSAVAETEIKQFKESFRDSQEFQDAVADLANKTAKTMTTERVGIITKAKTFVDKKYNFDEKDNNEIMRDSIKTQSNEEFKDEELPVAFKMLKKVADYSQFADAQSKTGRFEHLKDKDL